MERKYPMSEHSELLKRIEDTSARRCWLLAKALECLPLDHAIELARTAEAFVAGSLLESRSADATPAAELRAPPSLTRGTQSKDRSSRAATKHPASRKRVNLALSADRREELLDRLAAGSTNVELAAEFELSAQQVQGVRVGSAREIARRREALDEATKLQPKDQRLAETAGQIYNHLPQQDDVVRYLRQKDDVVIRQADGTFLVNGRFQMSLAELAERANRMRRRQGKPEFQLAETEQQTPKQNSPAGDNGHRMFGDAV
jgi:hypothetical protein